MFQAVLFRANIANASFTGVFLVCFRLQIVYVLPREGLQWKARSAARTWNGKPDPKGHAQNLNL
ncbi:hypothetical protein [Mucilaginibacter sp.]|uniref:hypothetical protein n=1 Tax=Mucilaginibacter sp. TaxID=1882438 RepID=UPI003B001C29